MKVALWALAVIVLAQTVAKATCMTNEEFFLLVKPYATDIEVFDIDDDVSDDVDVGDVITLPGNPDDDVDFDYILKRLGVHFDNSSQGIDPVASNLWWHHHHHHHHHHHNPSFKCGCHHDRCTCCAEHTFSVNLWVKHIRFHLKACLEVAYLRSNIGFELTFTINNHRLYHKEISLKHPPGLCFGVPGLSSFARVCLELYDINLATKHMCARLTGVIDLKLKKFRVHLKLGCFRIPVLDTDAFLQLTRDPDFLRIKPLEDQRPRDLAALFRGLQVDDSEEYEEY